MGLGSNWKILFFFSFYFVKFGESGRPASLPITIIPDGLQIPRVRCGRKSICGCGIAIFSVLEPVSRSVYSFGGRSPLLSGNSVPSGARRAEGIYSTQLIGVSIHTPPGGARRWKTRSPPRPSLARCFYRFDLAKEWPNSAEIVVPAMLKEPRGLWSHPPVACVLQTTPLIDLVAHRINDGSMIVLML